MSLLNLESKDIVVHNNEIYYSVSFIAKQVKRSYSSIYMLIHRGGKQPNGSKAKLPSTVVVGSRLVKKDDLTTFYFHNPGRNAGFYRYKISGLHDFEPVPVV